MSSFNKSFLFSVALLGFTASSLGAETKYYYDALGRLFLAENLETGDVEYKYDDAGNRTQVDFTPPPCCIVINYSWSIVSNPFLGESIRFEWTSNGDSCGGEIRPGGPNGYVQLSGSSSSVTFQSSATQQRASLTCTASGEISKVIETTFTNGCADC